MIIQRRLSNFDSWILAFLLTAHEHEANGENFFGLRIRGNVSKSDRRQTGDREIHRCYITGLE